MKKFLLLTTCISALSFNFGSDAFLWSNSKYELKQQLSYIMQYSKPLQGDFPEEAGKIILGVDGVVRATTPEAALEILECVINTNLSISDGATPRTLVKDIPAETKQKKTPIKTETRTSSRWLESNAIAVLQSWERELYSNPNIEVHTLERDYDRWGLLSNYGIRTRFTEYKTETITTKDAVKQTHKLAMLLHLAQELKSKIISQKEHLHTLKQATESAQRQIAESKIARETARQKRLAEEAIIKQREDEKKDLDAAGLRKLGLSYLLGTKGHQEHCYYAKKLLEEAKSGCDAEASILLAKLEFYGETNLASILRGAPEQEKYSFIDPKRSYISEHCRLAFVNGYPGSLDPNTSKFNEHYNKTIGYVIEGRKREMEIREAKGDGAKLNQLGLHYKNLPNAEKWDLSYSVRFFRLSHQAGNLKGTINLALIYIQGLCGERANGREGFIVLQEAYKRGDCLDASAGSVIFQYWNEATKDLQLEEQKRLAEEAEAKKKQDAEQVEYQRRQKEITDANGDGATLNRLGLHYKNMPNAKLADKKHALHFLNYP